jgi:hypothetical protein
VASTPTESGRTESLDELARRELAREAATMALYVSITLLGTLVAIPSDDVPGSLRTAALIWGGAAGLALAHWLAFDVGARLFATAGLERLHRLGGPMALAAALAVAALTSIPILIAPEELAPEAAISVLALILAVAGFAAARRNGAGVKRALAGGAVLLGVAAIVVAIKIAIDH